MRNDHQEKLKPVQFPARELPERKRKAKAGGRKLDEPQMIRNIVASPSRTLVMHRRATGDFAQEKGAG